MSLQIGLVREFITLEAWGLDDILQHATHIAVDVLDIQTTSLHSTDNILSLGGIARHHQVVACADFLLGGQLRTLAYPVGHHNAFKAPLITKDGTEHILITLGIDAIDEIVRRHQRPRI